MKKESIVIGAGIVGVSVAWHLQSRGYQVTLIDAKEPGEETSYGNAGLIQREAIYPHPFPIQIKEILRILPNKSNDIRYRIKALTYYAKPLLKYWKNSYQNQYEKIVNEWKTLIENSTKEHQVMLDASNSEDLIQKKGWIQLFRSEKNLESALSNQSDFNKSGVEYQVLTPASIKELEPNLNVEKFVGAIHWLNAWQVKNPSKLVKAYAKSFEDIGGVIIQKTVESITDKDGAWKVTTTTKNEGSNVNSNKTLDDDKELFTTENLVIAAGPWSAEMLQPLGYDFPLFPIRGYHKHYQLLENVKLNHSIVDNENGFVLSPQEQGVRLTTGAEFSLKSDPICMDQLALDEIVSKEMISLGESVEETPWFGHRPCMPDMKPIIGPAYNVTGLEEGHFRKGLWLAFGHAHQGFTLGPATGRLLAEMMVGEQPYINPLPFASNRFFRS